MQGSILAVHCAAEHADSIDAAWVQRLAVIVPIASYGQGDGAAAGPADAETPLSLVEQLEGDLPKYLAAARGFTCNHKDVDEFTAAVLGWWKNHGDEVGAWAIGATLVFSLSPYAAERLAVALQRPAVSADVYGYPDYYKPRDCGARECCVDVDRTL